MGKRQRMRRLGREEMSSGEERSLVCGVVIDGVEGGFKLGFTVNPVTEKLMTVEEHLKVDGAGKALTLEVGKVFARLWEEEFGEAANWREISEGADD